MKVSKSSLRTTYTIFIIIALSSFDNAVIGLFPPLFTSMAKDFNIPISLLGTVSAASVFVIALSSVLWAYLADKGKRKRLIIIGTMIWSISVFMTANSKTYTQLLVSQMFTGVGLGCITSIGYSLLTDYMPKKWRGMILSLWGMFQGLGGISGSVMASIIATTTSWRKPFEVISILGLLFALLYLSIKEPQKGSAEPELKGLVQNGQGYEYSIEYCHIHEIIEKKSNQWLMLQGLFMNITTGTLIWLPTLYTAKLMYSGYSAEAAIICSGFLYALLQVGGTSSIYFGYLGDKLQRNSYSGRATLTAFLVLAAMPLYIFMFLVPMRNLNLPDTSNSIVMLLALLKEFLTNPWMFLMFILAVAATAAQSANTPNSLAILTDVNLPEYRTTAFSMVNLINGTGKSISNIMIGIVLSIVSAYHNEPYNFIITMIIFQVFLIPSALSYIKVSKTLEKDIKKMKSVLKYRAETLAK